MRPSSPALLDQIVKRLQTGQSPRSSADLAKEFLGVGLLDETQADRLLVPILGADPRFVRTDLGWEAADRISSIPETGLALDRPFIAVFAPANPAPPRFMGRKGPAIR